MCACVCGVKGGGWLGWERRARRERAHRHAHTDTHRHRNTRTVYVSVPVCLSVCLSLSLCLSSLSLFPLSPPCLSFLSLSPLPPLFPLFSPSFLPPSSLPPARSCFAGQRLTAGVSLASLLASFTRAGISSRTRKRTFTRRCFQSPRRALRALCGLERC